MLLLTAAAVAVAVVAAGTPAGTSWAAEAIPGSAGTDTAVALTDSQLTVSGRGRFSELKVTVNQTKNLANQAISVTWSGGTPTTAFGGGSGTIGEHFLQMFQCWGDDDGSSPDNPGPPPEQCQQGATNGVFPGPTQTAMLFGQNTVTRRISQEGAPNFDPSQGSLDAVGTVWKPFRAVDGTVIPQQADVTFDARVGGNYWLNPFFNVITTNEIAGSRTAENGKGADLFEATTGLESTGLGCGQKVQKDADGSSKVPRCWLVVVPRGSAPDENEGAGVSPSFGVSTSPLAPSVWKNRIAIPLEFNPVDSSCALTADQRRIVGSELLAAAVASWQPALCAVPASSPYAYGTISDSRARDQLLSGTPGAPGMAVVSRPIDPGTIDPLSPVVYAPLTLSGTVIGFNVERKPKSTFPEGVVRPEGLDELAGVRVAQLNLTPRLVAKLLTQSYRSQVDIKAIRPDYPWAEKNPAHIAVDPDFLQFNPEFALLENGGKNLGGLVMPSPNSDAARQVWEWVFSDAEAKSWIGGAADPWGMNVNPVYSSSPSLNPQGTSFGDPLPDSYPKSDPYCVQEPDAGPLKVKPPQLCGLDWLPYTQGLRDSARATRAATDGARTEVNPSPASTDQVYTRDPPQALASRSILSVTDTASAAQYGVQMARLSQAGDNAPSRAFVAPDEAGLSAGGRALAAKDVPGFLEPSPSTSPSEAYPLTALTYAAVAPLNLDATARTEYAAFVDYAAGPGQMRGFEYGKLPAGYQPLPEELRTQGREAATTIRDLAGASAIEEAAVAAGATAPEGTSALGTEAIAPGPGAGASSSDPAKAKARARDGAGAPGAPGSTDPPKKQSAIERIVDAVRTPVYGLAATRYALPLLVVVALLSALGALELTKRPFRRRPPQDEALAVVDQNGAL